MSVKEQGSAIESAAEWARHQQPRIPNWVGDSTTGFDIGELRARIHDAVEVRRTHMSRHEMTVPISELPRTQ